MSGTEKKPEVPGFIEVFNKATMRKPDVANDFSALVANYIARSNLTPEEAAKTLATAAADILDHPRWNPTNVLRARQHLILAKEILERG